MHDERIAVTCSSSMNGDSVEHDVTWRVGEAAAEKVDAVPGGDDATEDFAEVNLRPARLRIQLIQPVQDEDLH